MSLFGCFDRTNDDDLIGCFVQLVMITQCFVRSNCSGWLVFALFDCFVRPLVATNNVFFVICQLVIFQLDVLFERFGQSSRSEVLFGCFVPRFGWDALFGCCV